MPGFPSNAVSLSGPDVQGSSTWRLIDTPPAPGVWNMAVDDALAESVAAGGVPTVRLYRWDPPCLSLGRNQPARGYYDLETLRARGVDVVRRTTGGRAVLHDRELTYSVAVPQASLGGPRASYETVNRGLVAGLRRLGVPAEVQGRTGRRAPLPSLAPCFGEAAEGEVVVDGRKLLGSAQRRQGGVLLQHGSLPLEGDPSPSGGLEREPDAAAEPISLAALCHPLPSWDSLVAALVTGWEETLGVRLDPAPLSAPERQRARELESRYRDPAWTWHR